MTADLTTLDASVLADKIHSREVSSVEVTQAHLDRIAAVDSEYHAFLHVAGEQALEAAAAVDSSWPPETGPRLRSPVSRLRSRTSSPPPTCRRPVRRRCSKDG